MAGERNSDSVKSGREHVAAVKVTIENRTYLTADVFCVDQNGREIKKATLESWQSTTIHSFERQQWIVRDSRSGVLLNKAICSLQDLLISVDGNSVRSSFGGTVVEVAVKNQSGFNIQVRQVNTKGSEKTVAMLKPGETRSLKTRHGHVWRIREKSSQAELNLYIAGDSNKQRLAIENTLVRTLERPDALLWEGEVALYEEERFGGRVWIVHQDMADFTLLADLNDRISSIRLGPNTAVTLFGHTRYRGDNDVFYMDTISLRESELGDNQLSSMRVHTVLSAGASQMTSTSRLTEDILLENGKRMSRPVYRCIVTLPPMTGAVDVWGTEETALEVNGKRHVVDAVKPARFKPSTLGKLIMLIPATKLGNATLMLRTNTMAATERFFVFPDSDVHSKIVTMEKDSVWKQRHDLGVDTGFSKNDVAQVQDAIQMLSGTVPVLSGSGTAGRNQQRLTGETMSLASWSLDFGGEDRKGAASLKSISDAEIASINATAERIDGNVGQAFGFIKNTVKKASATVNKVVIQSTQRAANDAAALAERKARHAAAEALRLKQAAEQEAQRKQRALQREAAAALARAEQEARRAADEALRVKRLAEQEAARKKRELERAAAEAARKADELRRKAETELKKAAEVAAKEAERAAIEAQREITRVAEAAAREAESAARIVAGELEKAAEQVLTVTLEIGGKLYQLTVDTVDALGEVVEEIIRQTGILWNKFVDWLQDVFGWNDILETHDFIAQSFNNGIDSVQSTLGDTKKQVEKFLKERQGDITRGVDNMIDQLGTSDFAEKSNASDFDMSQITDQLDWIMDKVFGGNGGAGKSDASDHNTDLKESISTQMLEQFEQLLKNLITKLQEKIDQDFPVIVDAMMDALHQMQGAIADPARAPQLILGALLSMMKGVLVAALSIVDIVVGTLFDLVIAVFELLQIVFNASIEIPFVSDLYRQLTRGRSLTLLSACSLMLAIPVTIAGKIIMGRPPFQGAAALAQSESDGKLGASGWAVSYGVVHLFVAATDGVADTLSSCGADDELPPILPGFSMFLAVMAQLTGKPAFEDYFRKNDDLAASFYQIVWKYQWLYTGLAAISFFGSKTKITGYIVPAATACVSKIHFGLMVAMAGMDLTQFKGIARKDTTKAKDDLSLVMLRYFGWLLDPVPGVTKFWITKEMNEPLSYVPLAVHIKCASTAHLAVAGMYFAQAGLEDDWWG